MGTRIVQVDAFTNRPFGGNPAAVCVLDAPAPDAWMQDVATEMNLSETAFLHPLGTSGVYNLRWFTPSVEVDLCGHATLASSHVLWQEGHLSPEAPALFDTRSGRLTATRKGSWIELDFPAEPLKQVVENPEEIREIEKALGTKIVSAARNRFDLLVELESEQAVRALRPDYGLVGAIPVRGVIATSRSETPEFDFVSRFFAPRVGVDEDPVCGSAHCFSGPFWADRLGRAELTAHQVSRREGVIKIRLAGDRVFLGGQAVTTLKGDLVG
mgnify:CR=1 FL=1